MLTGATQVQQEAVDKLPDDGRPGELRVFQHLAKGSLNQKDLDIVILPFVSRDTKQQATYCIIIHAGIHDPVPFVQRRDAGQHSRCEETHFLGFTNRLVENNLKKDGKYI